MNKVTEQLKTNNVKLKGIVTQVGMLFCASLVTLFVSAGSCTNTLIPRSPHANLLRALFLAADEV